MHTESVLGCMLPAVQSILKEVVEPDGRRRCAADPLRPGGADPGGIATHWAGHLTGTGGSTRQRGGRPVAVL